MNALETLLSGRKIQIFNANTGKKFVLTMNKNINVSIKNILDIADTDVHSGFMNSVSDIGNWDGNYSEIRRAENNKDIPFVLVRGKQTVFKAGGQTMMSI